MLVDFAVTSERMSDGYFAKAFESADPLVERVDSSSFHHVFLSSEQRNPNLQIPP